MIRDICPHEAPRRVGERHLAAQRLKCNTVESETTEEGNKYLAREREIRDGLWRADI